MKNSIRYLVLVLVGLACVVGLVSCSPRAEKTKTSIRQTNARCTRVVLNKLPGKWDSLTEIFYINGDCVLATRTFEDDPLDEDDVFYKVNLGSLTLAPYQIAAKNQRIRYWEHFGKATLFLVHDNNHYSVIVNGSGPEVTVTLPFKFDKNLTTIPHPFLNQNSLFVVYSNRLLRWDISDGKVVARPEAKLKLSRWFETSSLSEYSPWIESKEGEKLWVQDASDSDYIFNLKTHETKVVKEREGHGMLGLRTVQDNHNRLWSWIGAGDELTCRSMGQEIAKYDVAGIKELFFDKDDNPLVWTKTGVATRMAAGKWKHHDLKDIKSIIFDKRDEPLVLTQNGVLLKLIDDRWVKVLDNLDFVKKSKEYRSLPLEDGRICLLSGFSGDPRIVKDFDRFLAIIDVEKAEYELMRFPYEY